MRSLRAAARAAARAGQWRDASFHYQALASRRGATASDLIQLAHSLKETDDTAAALGAYREAAIKHPLNVDAQRQLGLFLRRLGREADALDQLARALVLDPTAPDLKAEIASFGLDDSLLDHHVLVGLAGGRASRPPDPHVIRRKRATLLIGRARRFARSGKWSEAHSAYQRAVLLDPTRVTALVQFGHANLQLGLYESALTTYRRALLLSPRDPDIYLHTGHALKKLDRRDSAFASYLAAWRLQPGLAEAAEEMRGIHSWVDDAWLRSAVGNPGQIAPSGAFEKISDQIEEPPGLERQYRHHFWVLASGLAASN